MLFCFGFPPKGEARVCRRCYRINVSFWNVYPCYVNIHRTKKVTVL